MNNAFIYSANFRKYITEAIIPACSVNVYLSNYDS